MGNKEYVSIEELQEIWDFIIIVLKSRCPDIVQQKHAEEILVRFAYYEREFYGILLDYVKQARRLKAFDEKIQLEIAITKAKRGPYKKNKKQVAVCQHRL